MHKHFTDLLRFAFLALSTFCATVTYAQNTPASPGYIPISPPQPTSTTDKVEVIEVFSYGCIHCAQFQPTVDAWTKRMDKSVVKFMYLPATFNPLFKLMARGYYAADSLDVAESTHQRVFDALFLSGKQVNNLDTLADLYASFGVNRAAFIKAAQSFFVESELNRADELTRAYGVDGTPTLIVAGKYRITGETAGANEKMFDVVDQLVAKEKQSIKEKSRTK